MTIWKDIQAMSPRARADAFREASEEQRAIWREEAACAEEPEGFPRPRPKFGAPPCGECHLKPGEICDICGAANDAPLTDGALIGFARTICADSGNGLSQTYREVMADLANRLEAALATPKGGV